MDFLISTLITVAVLYVIISSIKKITQSKNELIKKLKEKGYEYIYIAYGGEIAAIDTRNNKILFGNTKDSSEYVFDLGEIHDRRIDYAENTRTRKKSKITITFFTKSPKNPRFELNYEWTQKSADHDWAQIEAIFQSA